MDHVQSQVNEVKVILTDNISKVLQRGERLDDLIGKSDDLQASVSVQTPGESTPNRMFSGDRVRVIVVSR